MTSVRVGRHALHTYQMLAQERGDLLVWTIYDHPSDVPHAFVVRPHSTKLNMPLTVHFEHTDLERVRTSLANLGLVCIPRADEDDPAIIESWV